MNNNFYLKPTLIFLVGIFVFSNFVFALPNDATTRIDFSYTEKINYTLVNTNNSLFLLGYNWETNPYRQWWYNMTTTSGGGNPFNQQLNTSSNVTFDDAYYTGQLNFTRQPISNGTFLNIGVNQILFERNGTGLTTAEKTASLIWVNKDSITTGCELNVTQGATPRYSLCGETWNVPGVSTFNIANLAFTGNNFISNRYLPAGITQIFNASYSLSPSQQITSTGSLANYYTQTFYTRTTAGNITFIPADSVSINKVTGFNAPSLSIMENHTSTTGYSFVINGNSTRDKLFYVAKNGNVTIGDDLIVMGNLSVKRPYGMFSDTSTQTVAVANTPYAMKFNTTEDIYLIKKLADNSNISFLQTGDYLIELSIMGSSSVANTHLEVWVKKNGINIPRSNTRYEFKGVNTEAVISVPFIIDMNTTDKFEVWYAGDNTGITLPYTTNTSYSPETPSAIMTISKLSEITEE